MAYLDNALVVKVLGYSAEKTTDVRLWKKEKTESERKFCNLLKSCRIIPFKTVSATSMD